MVARVNRRQLSPGISADCGPLRFLLLFLFLLRQELNCVAQVGLALYVAEDILGILILPLLTLRVPNTTPGLCSAKDQTQGLQ